MSRIAKLARPVQLDLFQEPPTTPTWHQMPAEVRARRGNSWPGSSVPIGSPAPRRPRRGGAR